MEGMPQRSKIEATPKPIMTVEKGGLHNSNEEVKTEAVLKIEKELSELNPEIMAKNLANPEKREKLKEKLQLILVACLALGLATFFVESLIDLSNNPPASEYAKSVVETMREVKVGLSGAFTAFATAFVVIKNSINKEKWQKLEKAKQ